MRPPLITPTDAGLAKIDALLAEGVPSTSRPVDDFQIGAAGMTGHHVPRRAAATRRSGTTSTGSSSTASAGETFDVLDPVSNETYVTAAAGQTADVDLAVAAATPRVPRGAVAAA